MDLYFAPLACSMATRIALHEARAETRVRFIQVDTHAKKIVADGSDFLAVNPLGQVPVLRRDDGRLLTENAAVLQHVARALPDAGLLGRPDEIDELQHWLSFVGTELHKAIYAPLLSGRSSEHAKVAARVAAEPRFDRLEAHLAGRDFLLDAFSIADAYLATVLNWSRASGIDLAHWPDVRRYARAILARPGAARAFAEERALFEAEQKRHAA